MGNHEPGPRLIEVRKEHEVSFFDMYLKELVNKVLFVGDKCIRHDIIIRLMAVECYMRTGETGELYEKLQKRRMATLAEDRDLPYDPGRFPRLIESFGEIGFGKETPIIIGRNEKIIEGAHRLACCICFSIDLVPMELWSDAEGGGEDLRWFAENFTEEENNVIARRREEIRTRFCEA